MAKRRLRPDELGNRSLAGFSINLKAPAITAIVSGLATVVAALIATLATPEVRNTFGLESRSRMEDLEAQVKAQQAAINRIEKRLAALPTQTPSTVNTSPATAAVTADVAAVRERLSKIEQAILADPAKALAVPLLRQELDGLKVSYQKDVDAANRAVDRVYDQNKWFIGLMFTMAIGVISLGISNFAQLKRSSQPSPPKEEADGHTA